MSPPRRVIRPTDPAGRGDGNRDGDGDGGGDGDGIGDGVGINDSDGDRDDGDGRRYMNLIQSGLDLGHICKFLDQVCLLLFNRHTMLHI